jgi:hypothetical protein
MLPTRNTLASHEIAGAAVGNIAVTGVNASGGGTILTNGNNSLGSFISNGTFSGPLPVQ